MKSELRKLKLEKLTIARITTSGLKNIQGGSSDPTDPDHTADPELSREMGCTYSLFQ